MMRSAPVVLAAGLLLAASLAGAQTIDNPDLFGKSLEVARQALEQYGPYDNPAEAERIADIGYRVAAKCGYTKMPFTFHLIDMPDPNAFALPGGHIFVTRGMLDLKLDDDMVAALLGHEIAHVVHEDYLHMRKKATLMNVLSQALMVGVLIGAENHSGPRKGHITTPYDVVYGQDNPSGDLVQGAAAASLVVNELLLRSYSRENEAGADQDGQRWAAAAGFDPDGAEKLMTLLGERIPQSKKYGYWMTHPFFDERVRSAAALGKLLKRQEAASDIAYREATQSVLLGFVDKVENKDRKKAEATRKLIQHDALSAWPQGPAAEKIRFDDLHTLRDGELAGSPLARDYGKVIAAYERQIGEVRRLTPGSAFLKTAADELRELETGRDALYPKAVEVLAGGIFETPFLETFLSNFPKAPEVPKAALALGDARARLGQSTDAVEHYLQAWKASPDSPEGKRAAAGLRNLAPTLNELAALQELALQDRDPELGRLAEARLKERVNTFSDIANGAQYLKRYPDGTFSRPVIERVNQLADNLYAEVVLYQAVGDHAKALERINQILTHAPTSPAAERLRDRAVLES